MKLALVFDDGHRRSCAQIAALFEEFGLPAVFAVVAAPPPREFPAAGDWAFWNELAMRGHRIDPHGLDHTNLAEQPPATARASVRRCLDLFGERLRGFEPKRAVFHYPFNAGTPDLNHWLCGQVAAVRVAGGGLNSAAELSARVIHCTGFGPGPCDEFVRARLAFARQSPAAGLVLCLHGVDEGWGPVRLATVRHVLEEVRRDPNLEYWPLTFPAAVPGS